MIAKWQQRLGNHDNLLFTTRCAGILQIGMKSHKVLYNHRDNHYRIFGALRFVHTLVAEASVISSDKGLIGDDHIGEFLFSSTFWLYFFRFL
jgi:hypothetical protein